MTSRAPLGLLIAMALVGCDGGTLSAPLTEGTPPDTGDAGTTPPTTPPATPPGTPPGPPEPPPGSVVRADLCGNGLDDDADGEVDEGCGCTPGSSQSCYQGPPGTSGVGECRSGAQYCVMEGEFPIWGPCMAAVLPAREIIDTGKDEDCDGTTDEPDGICIADEFGGESAARCTDMRDNDCDGLRDCEDPSCLLSPEAACPGGCQAREATCFGGVDDDCDGAVDCDDAECAGDAACRPPLCPGGGSPVFRRRPDRTDGGGSWIMPGDGGALMPMTCEGAPPIPCDATLVAVETAPGSFACVPPPGDCAPGTFAHWAGSGWTCTEGCELLIHYGGIYGFRTVCAPSPPDTLACAPGEAETFIYETEMWACAPMCDNGLYDIHYVDGGLVCIPC